MPLSESIRLAWEGLKANKMRAFLTMLGIIIGIASVIGILTVGDSLSNSVQSSMSSLGSSNITVTLQDKSSATNSFVSTRMAQVSAVASKRGLFSNDADQNSKISDDMINSLKSKYSEKISGIALSESVGSGYCKFEKNNANIDVSGVNSDYFKINELTILKGRTIQDKDLNNARNLAIVSDKLVNNLFGGDFDFALGKEIAANIDGTAYTFRIIGIYRYEYANEAFVADSEKNLTTDVYIPISTAKKLIGTSDGYSSFTLTVGSGVENTTEFADDIADFLNKYYQKNDSYQVAAVSMESVLGVLDSITSTISIALSLIAGISLLVGGIGVMNIMLVSVTERTKEIGTRKALGATNRNIRTQFVVESIIVCLIGGVIGIIIGAILGGAGTSYMGFFSLPSLSSIALSVGFSLAIGIFFGYYPANKAAMLDPIEALRYE